MWLALTAFIVVNVVITATTTFKSPQMIQSQGPGQHGVLEGCTAVKGSVSRRVAIPDFLSVEDAELLVSFAKRGMEEFTSEFGPTIFDPDLLMVMGPGANVKRVNASRFSDEELSAYGRMMIATKRIVMREHGLTTLFHTVPTFIARLRPPPSSSESSSQHVHDEYWHMHVDRNNTSHYDYSALLYLSDAGIDFEGGMFHFDGPTPDDVRIITPRKRMLITFASGPENPHHVTQVIRGTRFALSTWWTCSKKHHFTKSRLLGKMMNDEQEDDRMEL